MPIKTDRFVNRVGILTLALVCGVTGCGGGRAAVRGNVNFDGASVDNGTIVFIPEGDEETASNRAKVGVQIVNGVYSINAERGALPGKYRVEITWDKKTGRKISSGSADSRDETAQMLPTKYNRESTLTAEIKSGKNEINFQLTP